MIVAKANAYGCGERTVPPLVDDMDEVWGYMVVRPFEALAIASTGVKKPVFLMAPASDDDSVLLAKKGVHLAMTANDTPERVKRLSARAGGKLKVHFEIDTGINRQGRPHWDAAQWATALYQTGAIEVHGTASYFIVPPGSEPQTEPWGPEVQQIERFNAVTDAMTAAGVPLGTRHMASSRSYFQYPEAHFEAMRTGVLSYGMYPTAEARASGVVDVEQVYEMKVRLAQVSMIRAGEYFGYGRKIQMEKDTWIATTLHGVPAGTRRDRMLKINGKDCEVILSGGRLYTIAVLGEEKIAERGDVALICGRAPGYTAEDLNNPWIGYGMADPMVSMSVA